MGFHVSKLSRTRSVESAFVIKRNYTAAVSYVAQITTKFISAIGEGNKCKRLDSKTLQNYQIRKKEIN